MGAGSDICLAILAIFIPPLSVLIAGNCADLLINICLCFLLWLPAVIHAWYIIFRHAEKRKDLRRDYAIPANQQQRYAQAPAAHYGTMPPPAQAQAYPPVDPYYAQQTGSTVGPPPAYDAAPRRKY